MWWGGVQLRGTLFLGKGKEEEGAVRGGRRGVIMLLESSRALLRVRPGGSYASVGCYWRPQLTAYVARVLLLLLLFPDPVPAAAAA